MDQQIAPDDQLMMFQQALHNMHVAIDKSSSIVLTGKVSKWQIAISELTPGTANIALGIGVLFVSRLLLPAEILIRTLLDRVCTLAYFRCEGEAAIKQWEDGWKENNRAGFARRLSCLSEEIYPSHFNGFKGKAVNLAEAKKSIIDLLSSLHSSVHGDLASIENTFVREDGKFSLHVIGRDDENLSYFSSLCSLATMTIMYFVFELEQGFVAKDKIHI